jgi:putative ABC transport system permease protein
MNLVDIKYIFRQLLRKKYYTLLNVFGLGIGLGCAMLMAIYLIHEFSFDRFHSKSSQLYRVIVDKRSDTPYAMGEAFRNEVPEITNVFRLYNMDEIHIIKDNEAIAEKSFAWADSSIFSMLDFNLIAGSRDQLLSETNDILVSEKIARKYFPNENPVGKPLRIKLLSANVDYTVKGVFSDLPSNSSLQIEFLVNIKNSFDLLSEIVYAIGLENSKEKLDYLHDWSKDEYSTFVQLAENANIDAVSRKCSNISQAHLKEKSVGAIFLQPFTDMYLHSSEIDHSSQIRVNQVSSLKIFMGIGLLILLVACVNFILVSNADSARSIMEFACRKVNGASRIQVFTMSILKTCLVALVSLIPALLFLYFTLPFFNSQFQKELHLSLLLQWQYMVVLLSIVLFTGILAGLYIGFYTSSVSPARLIQNKGNLEQGKGRIKGLLVITQFVAFILLCTSFMFMMKQYDFSLKKDIGINTKNVMVVWLKDENVRANAQIIRDNLAANPNVSSCVLTSFFTPPSDNVLNIGYTDKNNGNKKYNIEGLVLGTGELELLQIPILRGVTFTHSNTLDMKNILINEAAAKLLKVDVGGNISSFKVIGVVPNFHFHSLHQPVKPIVILSKMASFYNLAIKSNGNNKAIEAQLKTLCHSIAPGFSYETEMLNERLGEFYKKEEKQMGTIGFFSVIALVLSVMGLLGFVSLSLGKRTKEIGIRKINGADVNVILRMFYLQYIRWVVLAFTIATPIAWYAMHQWLENFAYKTELSWWVFALAGMLALAVALLTVSWQSWRAATRNPVESLRYE